MPDRIEFGLPRTSCACEVCVNNCRHMPGMLIPADLERMIPPSEDPYTWSLDNLLASPGAIVRRGDEIFRIPTLVPAVKPGGACINLTPEGRCAIHAVAPFGCAYFDCGPERSGPHRDGLSKDGLIAVMRAHADQSSLYPRLWIHLWANGKRQEPPEILRARMAQDERKERPR